MALIELNLEKPALKRTELLTEEETVETTETTETTETNEASTDTIDAESEEIEDTEADVEAEEETGGRSTPRKFARRIAILGGTAAGLAAARKFQKRRGKSAEAEQEFEEDWQTAE